MNTTTKRLSAIRALTTPLGILSLGGLILAGTASPLHAGWFTGANDPADGCATGSGGGDPTHGTSPGSPDPVTGVALTGGTPISCGVSCGGNSSGSTSGNTGGAGSVCCPEDGNGGSWPGGGDWDFPGGWSPGGGLGVIRGMPVWEVSEPYINLWLYDEPLGYQPGIGPRISFMLAYKQRGTDDVSIHIFNLGKGWTCSWLSYVEDDGSGTKATLNTKLGGQIVFSNLDGTVTEYLTHTTLKREAQFGNLTGFTRSYANGVNDYYQSIPEHGVLLPDGNTPVFLTARTDPFGRTNILFGYDEPVVNGSRVFRLTSVTDADGRVASLAYTNTDYPSRITGVTDPFGRTAILKYDNTGMLTNITDAAALSSSFTYDNQNWVTNLVTPYGQTTFLHVDNGFPQSADIARAITVIDPAGGTNVYMLREQTITEAGDYSFLGRYSSVPFPSLPGVGFDTGYLAYRDSFHWGPLQASTLPAAMNVFGETEYLKARTRHWLHAATDCDNYDISRTLSWQIDPSPDGIRPGQATCYSYDGMPQCFLGSYFHEGTNSLPAVVARVLPDGTTWYTTYQRDDWGRPTTVTDTYSPGYAETPNTRSRHYFYDGLNPDLLRVIGPRSETLAGYAYTNHLLRRVTNAVGDTTFYSYDPQGRLTGVKTPAGLTRTNLYFPSGQYSNFVQTAIDLEISRTNTFAYSNNLVYTLTDERGLTTTNLYDTLDRLTNSANPLGAMSYLYNKLDLVRVTDRMGFTSHFGYDAVRRRTAETNVLGRFTLYNYCTCGALDYIQDAAGNYTLFSYDNAGRRIETDYPDGYSITNYYDLLGRATNVVDSARYSVTNWFDNQGQLYAVQDAAGYTSYLIFDDEDRATNSYDANAVSVTMTYDNLGRLLTRSYPDGGTEYFGYAARGLVAYTNQLNFTNGYFYDQALRKTAETNANGQGTRFTYSPAGDLLTLTDGKSQTTTWGYDRFGRVTNKLDQTSAEIFRYAYDPDNRLTNRWTPAKGTTVYKYDPVGNLTNIAYPASGTVKLAYDTLNRLTNMVDSFSTTRYTYDAAGQLLTEDGPFTSDTVTNTYSHRRRVALALQQPTGLWTNGFGWDAANRLTNVTSPAGTFAYAYTTFDPNFSGRLVRQLSLPSGAYITNAFDPVARLLATVLDDSGGGTLDAALYGYNAGNQRTAYTNAVGDYYVYSYDPIGQLTVAANSSSAWNRGYAYDSAWNLNFLTNNGTLGTFLVDTKNELTNAPVGALAYDPNGNLTNNPGAHLSYYYDDENRLIEILYFVPDPSGGGRAQPEGVSPNGGGGRSSGTGWGTYFFYDGLGRLRQRADMHYVVGIGYDPTNTVAYIYDGWRVIQERNEYATNLPTVSYTRGLDLSGSVEGAGGIGGLLARSSGYSSGNWTSHAFYHADGNGNITCLIGTDQSVVASYVYDPYGNTLSQSGDLADANVYRFSTKEAHVNSGMYYYGYRFYDPSLQKWINRDPAEEEGGINLYRFVENDPVNSTDALGLLAGAPVLPPVLTTPKPGPPVVFACTATFCCFYKASDYVCEKTGFHDWLGNKICGWRNNDREKCRKDCDDQHERESQDCRSRKGKAAQRKCLHEAFDRYSRCLAECNKL